MKKILILCVCLCFVFLLTSILPVHGESKIYDSVLRLHVVANSNSESDQALKLRVRDKIINSARSLTEECSTLEQTKAVIEKELHSICETALAEVVAQGYSYPVEARLGYEEYPRKTYASLCFPSGKYLSLQIRIGEAKGENWWCVLFPPLCLDAAKVSKTEEDAFISVGLSSEQYKIITETDSPTYKARFKLLELFGGGSD